MKINLRWSKKQANIINHAEVDEYLIKCIHNEKTNVVSIELPEHSSKRISKLKVESSPKENDVFNLKTGIRVAKLQMIKKICEHNIVELQDQYRRVYKYYCDMIGSMRQERVNVINLLDCYR